MAYGAGRGLRNLTLACAVVAGGAAAAQPVTVAALGDSLTQGYGLAEGEGLVPQLQAWLSQRGAEVTLINAGVSGDTTAGGRARLAWTLTPEVDALIVNLGGNDMLRGLPPEEVRANLDAILTEAGARGLPVLLVGLQAPGNWGPDYKAAFDAIFPELAARHGAILIDSFFAPLLAGGGFDPADMQADGIHPSAQGVRKLVEAMGPRVLELIARARAAR